MKNWMKSNGIYIVAFLIPWILIIAHSLVRNGWLMGGGSLLNGDTGLQLYPLFMEFWEKVHSGDSLFYSWNAGIGYDFYLNAIYYLISPLNVIILLFPKSWVANTMQFVMVLKWALSAVTMTYYFMHTKHNTLHNGKQMVSLMLGLAFALSNWMLSFLGYMNWGDVFILFPILLLLLERLMDDGNWKVYTVLLFLCILCNFYISYQLCIFLLIWFLLHISSVQTNKGKKTIIFMGSSILAALCSFVTLLPGVLGVSMRYNVDRADEKGMIVKSWVNSIFDLGKKLFIFDNDLVEWKSIQPNLYFTTALLVIGLCFFVTKDSVKDKIKYAALLIFFVISLCSGALLIFWHGFALPNGVCHRYLFLVVFSFLFVALKSICHLDSVKLKGVLILFVFEIIYFVIVFLKLKAFTNFYAYLITFLVLFFVNIILVLYVRRSIALKHVIVTLFIVVMSELCANAFYELKEYDIKNWDDVNEHKSVSNVLTSATPEPGERLDLIQCFKNFGLYEGVPNTNVFLSYCNGNMIELYRQLGLEFGDNAEGSVSGASPLINLMFNIRYGAGTSPVGFSDNKEVTKDGNFTLYRMNRLAGLGYMVDENILDWDIQKESDFDLQNRFVNLTTGEDDIFSVVKPDVTLTDGNLQYRCNEELAERGYYLYDYISTSVAQTEMTEFSFIVEEDMDLYIDTFSTEAMYNVIYLDEENIHKDNTDKFQGYYHIGNVKKGQRVSLYSIHEMGVGQQATLWFRLAKFNEDNYAKTYEKLSKNVYEIEEMTSSYVSGTIHADKDGIMVTSIPSMDGFRMYVDGNEEKYEKIGDALIGVPLTAGDHKVEFRYMTPYFKQGLMGSLVGIIIFITLLVFDRRKKNSSKNTVESKNVIEG